jgi:chromate transport protein ChrA
MHAAKAAARPVVTATTAGVGNPVVSFIEDVAAAAMTLLAILLPFLASLLVLILGFFIGRWFWRRHQNRALAA